MAGQQKYNRFLSTPSARRATACEFLVVLLHLFLSTPSARRATRKKAFANDIEMISIHALREEGDLSGQSGASVSIVFLSTPSARRATSLRS